MFSRIGTYPAVGMFTKAHIISVLVCVALIVTALIFTKKMNSKQYIIMLRVFAVLVTLMEILKIGWSISMGYIDYDSIVPLYFCSLYIYALWLSYSKNKNLREAGLAYIAFAGIIAGLVFIVCPTTSFTVFPIFHFRCIHSMLFHSMMVYSGVMLFITKAVKINLKLVLKYVFFCMFFMSIALILNVLMQTNFMFLANPNKIPLAFLGEVYHLSQSLYTITIVIAHMLLGIVVYGICKFLELFGIKIIDETEVVEEDNNN